MSIAYFIFAYFIEISCPASLAKILVETNIFRKIRETVFKTLLIRDLVMLNVPNGMFISIPNQLRILHSSHVHFSSLGIKPYFAKVSWIISVLRFASQWFY